MTRIFAKNQENRFGLFILFICTQFLVILVIYVCESYSTDLHIMQFFFWVPTSFNFLNGPYGFSAAAHLNASYFNVALYALIALCTTLPVWKHISQIEAQQSDGN